MAQVIFSKALCLGVPTLVLAQTPVVTRARTVTVVTWAFLMTAHSLFFFS